MTEAQPYAFGRATAQPCAMLGSLEKLAFRLARGMRGIVEPYCGSRAIVTPGAIDRTTMSAWAAGTPAMTSLSMYRLHPIRGIVTLRIDASLISLLVDRFYGGAGQSLDGNRKEFTPTETRLIARLSTQVIDMLVATFVDLATLEPHLMTRDTNVTQADIAPGETAIVLQPFEVDLGEKDSYRIELAYPLDGLNAVETHGTASADNAAQAVDPVWQAHLAQRMEDVRLTAKTVLARPNLKMTELIALKPGDVIPIHIARHLPLLIGDRVFAHGSIGEQDGRAAFMIDKLA